MQIPPSKDEGLGLISKLLDESISDPEFARLHALMDSDPALRKLYIQTVDQEIELFCRGEETFADPLPNPRRRANVLFPVVAICIALTLAAITIYFEFKRGKNPPVTGGGGGVPGTGEVAVPPNLPEKREIPTGPESWFVDFEEGLPEGWHAEFVQSGLPKGSRGAAKTAAKNDSGTDYRDITPPQSWSPGKFEIKENTHLHVTMKVEKAAHFNFFMLTHVPDPGRDGTCLYQFTNPAMWATEGRWFQVTIPLSEFSRKDQTIGQFVPGVGPETGEVAWQLFLSSATSKLSLLIDEIRVDTIGPGEFEIVELNE